jgi:hypothetical protein
LQERTSTEERDLDSMRQCHCHDKNYTKLGWRLGGQHQNGSREVGNYSCDDTANLYWQFVAWWRRRGLEMLVTQLESPATAAATAAAAAGDDDTISMTTTKTIACASKR